METDVGAAHLYVPSAFGEVPAIVILRGNSL